MNAKRATYTLLTILLLLGIFLVTRWQEPARREAFDRSPGKLKYTQHALCRMDCRKITREEILEILQKGVINLNRSDKRDKPCPTYALQGETSDGDKIRVIFAQCTEETRVVTCYNLHEEVDCYCPPGSAVPQKKKN